MYIFKLKKLNNEKFEINKESWFEDYVKKNLNPFKQKLKSWKYKFQKIKNFFLKN